MLKKRYQLAIVLLLSCFSLVWQTEGLVELFVCEHYERAICEGTPAYFTFSDQKGAETLIKKRWGKGIVYPRAEQEAMAAYTCQQAGPINTSLDKAKGKLSQLTPELRDQVAQLDAATHRLVIPWNIVYTAMCTRRFCVISVFHTLISRLTTVTISLTLISFVRSSLVHATPSTVL